MKLLSRVADFTELPCLGQMRENEFEYFLALASKEAKIQNIKQYNLYLVTYKHPDNAHIIKKATAESWNEEAKSVAYMHTPVVYIVDVSKYKVEK